MDFIGFPKIARLMRNIIITEKIDGTNAQICITEDGDFLVGSRTRWITPSDDNYGFAKWAYENKEELMKLGIGSHFGEWWGGGVQRGYELMKGDKRFSMFNTTRWALFNTEPKRIETQDPRIEKYQDILPSCCGLVPVLYEGIFDLLEINNCLEKLKTNGSYASPRFMKPEGIVVFHSASNSCFKYTLGNDGIPKSKVK